MPAVGSFPTLRTEVAGIGVAEIAQEYGTPTYVYDAAKIVQRLDDLSAFDVVRYAQKANSNLAVLNLVRQHGALVDCVSAGEIHRARKAGYNPGGDPPEVIYTADIFDRDSLDSVVEHEIHVNCGSADMIDQIGEAAPSKQSPNLLLGEAHICKGGTYFMHGGRPMPRAIVRYIRGSVAIGDDRCIGKPF